MWLEGEFPYYELNLDCSNFDESSYNFNVQKKIRKWNKMREKRKNGETADDEYFKWKLNFEIINEIH